jgi:hypothetical protein
MFKFMEWVVIILIIAIGQQASYWILEKFPKYPVFGVEVATITGLFVMAYMFTHGK